MATHPFQNNGASSGLCLVCGGATAQHTSIMLADGTEKPVQQLNSERLEARCRYAYSRGEAAKERGFMRVSPFYESPIEAAYFLAGFDGEPFDFVTMRLAHQHAHA